ncbi:hypothetical protein [Paracidovorax cattleyae]|uniref:Uncharacterized protein n=1 Tax=Paracidovorax cattleyae TaxID=80868 RepID=A0A1H0M919_9BURK|nr:hypothetical protein [Paracidovorax cattleyae]AVS74186.1 hypothetical protein C8240_09270 [Paracidovorax cattleyae]MBF9266151.1 hypothetical protein [Paracidovorax cattleyae]SDO76894.1 hypothetical protein SAMN04489708_103168 [Paracidovorax cattleyae]
MPVPPKQPPRFVPTLTDVVQVTEAAVPGGSPLPGAQTPVPNPVPAASPGGAVPAMAPWPAVPPVGEPVPAAAPSHFPAAALAGAPGPAPAVPVPAAPSPSLPSSQPAPAPDFSGIEEVVIHRIIQRVDVVLDQRLREAIATVVQEQTRSMVPRLREEVESVVRHAVYEAVADELASPGGPAQR